MPLEAWSPQRTALSSLANIWLAEGATAVTISINGAPVVSCSSGVSPEDASLSPQVTAPIEWEGQQAGEIRITGAVSAAGRARMAAEAQLVGLLLETEADLASMTDQLIQTQDQLLAVFDLGQLARRPMRLAERLLALADAAGRLLNVDGTAIVLSSDGTGPVVAQFPPAAQDETWLLALLACMTSAERAVLWQGDAIPEPLPDGVESLLMLPISSAGSTQGALVFWSAAPERFASPDAKLARAIAEHASVQIENALLHRERIAQARLETEMQLARQVQTNLLPKALPALPGLEVYAHTRPASHVGGDFFDFVADSEESTVFLVSDVSGKGISAALVMTMTRTIVRTILRSLVGQVKQAPRGEGTPRPASLLSLVNEELFHDLTELSMFATAFVAQYHHASRRLLYANAGHSPVIYMPAGARPQLLSAAGLPVGVLPSVEYTDRTLLLRPGDLLVAASDGFNETRSAAGEMFGLDRLLRCVEENAHLPVETIGQKLFGAVEAFRDGQMQEDDQTLVIAKGA
jgi:sigma-B regulation protein RsbU (phosphoserine phosphatase)